MSNVSPFFRDVSNNALYAAGSGLILAQLGQPPGGDLTLFDQMSGLEEGTDILIKSIGAITNRVETTKETDKMKEWLNTVSQMS